MTLTHLIKAAEKDYWRFDRNRDRAIQRRQIMQLYNLGLTPGDISMAVGCTDRQVHRAAADPTWDHGPDNPTPPDTTAARAAELEELADFGLNLACRLRDQDPQIVWDALNRLPDDRIRELAIVLLAAIPTDATKHQLYGWVYNLGETQ